MDQDSTRIHFGPTYFLPGPTPLPPPARLLPDGSRVPLGEDECGSLSLAADTLVDGDFQKPSGEPLGPS